MALPKSPSITTRKTITSATGTTGINRVGQSMTGRYLRVSTSAPQATSASLAISEGWIRIGPTSIQFRCPYTSTPIPGINTKINSTNAISNTGQASPRTFAVGSFAATKRPTRPSTANSPCLKNRSVLPPVSRSESIAEADHTIARPRASRNSVDPSIK